MPPRSAHPAPRPTSAAAGCPCGSGAVESACCARYWPGGALAGLAPDAQALMRSRYSAYVRGRVDHLLASWHPSTRPASIDPDPPGLHWLGLKVTSHRAIDADRAEVAFVAVSKVGGRAHRLVETSRFVREDGRWYYVDGDLS